MIVRRRELLAAFLAIAAAPRVPRRLVSLAPSITEAVFALGLGDRLVGVTSYCRYPPEAERLPRIGGYLTPSYEALVAARADLVIALPEHDALRPQLDALGVEVLHVDHRRVAGIVDGLRAIAARCGADNAEPLLAELHERLARAERTVQGRRPPRTLAALGIKGDRAGFRSVLGGGAGSLHDDLVARAGGASVLADSPVPYPSLSAEGLLRLDPDVILAFAPGRGDPAQLLEEWSGLSLLRAVRARRVHVFTEPFLSVPGPRLVRHVEALARALHPEAPGSAS